MKRRPKEPAVPQERRTTVRKEIIALLEKKTLSAQEISVGVSISEKAVYGHLEHISKSLERDNHKLIITPAECKKCGFVFKKRERLKKPGKCPVCHKEYIEEPLFNISHKSQP